MTAQIATRPSIRNESSRPSTRRYSPDNPPLSWEWDSRGWGFLGEVDDGGVYNGAYFDKYRGYADTDQGRRITRMRREFVMRHLHSGPVLDIGIGSGQFVEEMNNESRIRCDGFDVNPAGIAWLRRNKRERRPWVAYPAATLWDSMEHIENLRESLEGLSADQLFISMPIYGDEAEVFSSKHFRPDEHYWYFTERGLISFLGDCGYCCDEVDDFETSDCGREGILSFAFSKR